MNKAVPLRMRWTIFAFRFGLSSSSCRSKGYWQKSMAYSITPLDHTSASFPSYRQRLVKTSGAARHDTSLSQIKLMKSSHIKKRLTQTSHLPFCKQLYVSGAKQKSKGGVEEHHVAEAASMHGTCVHVWALLTEVTLGNCAYSRAKQKSLNDQRPNIMDCNWLSSTLSGPVTSRVKQLFHSRPSVVTQVCARSPVPSGVREAGNCESNWS